MTLYLKYRPKNFEELEGQVFIKQTLSQAVAQNKLVGAYLFCGPRGTGKTSTARMFAKAMNCLSPKEGNPCGECDICKSFDEEKLVDIIEIDAASYTGVDNVREIIERASFVPNVCKYKVYIIDEVHMLSKGAFNALLKILEEPPSHLKFILATTESHKIPETILSRCQRYDFKSLTSLEVKSRLLYIAEKEGVKIDDESLEYINKESQGGLRNAISLFEQLIENSQISFPHVMEKLGIPSQEKVHNFVDMLEKKDANIFSLFEEISQTSNITLFLKEVLFTLREKIITHFSAPEVGEYIFLLETLDSAYAKSKQSFDPKTAYFVGIVKCLQGQQTQVVSAKQPSELPPIPKQPMTVLSPKKEISQPTNIASLDEIELSPDDLFDVFGEDEEPTVSVSPEMSIEKQPPVLSSQNNSTGSKFDKELFIQKLKDIGSKGALTMSIRGSEINFDGKKLTLFAKTTISRNQMGTADALALMTQACELLGYQGAEVVIQ